MKTLKQLVATAGACTLAVAAVQPAQAQTTDGYHSIQVFPVVVDSGSFAQRFTFRNPDGDTAVNVAPSFYPGADASQATPLNCPAFEIPAGGSKVFSSLREVCPDLADGSQFGYLYTYETNASSQPYAAFSRISNPQGQGFTVEAFPAHTFTAATSTVTGLRRLAATSSTPAFQTNCFIGSLQDVSGPAPEPTTRVEYTIADATGNTIAASHVDIAPGKLVRLLDVFAAAGAPAGNYDNARITFFENGLDDDPGLMTFCTVQDNTSFGADFRIGKQARGDSTEYSSWAAQDDHVNRHTTTRREIAIPGEGEAKVFTIAPGLNSNTHLYYIRHPDEFGCELADPITHAALPEDYGLEMRLIGPDGSTVMAGGNGIQTFHDIWLGDKTDLNSGSNGRYTLEVESDTSSASERVYALHCHTGSGHSLGDMIRRGGPDRF